jgi:hypothetical protein
VEVKGENGGQSLGMPERGPLNTQYAAENFYIFQPEHFSSPCFSFIFLFLLYLSFLLEFQLPSWQLMEHTQ